MNNKSAHEPEAKVMSAADVWNDAQQIAQVLRQNLSKAEPLVKLQIPLSIFLAAVDEFNREERLLRRQRIEERRAA
jgi:hypothetical protein